MANIFSGAIRDWKSVLKFLAFSAAFFALQFGYQHFMLGSAFEISIVRASAFAGTTFFAAALASSVLFRFRPKLAVHWRTRRNFGVVGTFFILMHILSAANFIFSWDVASIYFSLDPFANPLIFGVIAVPMFLLLAILSTDWAVSAMGRNWKAVQRLVYLGYMLAIFHFAKTNPPELMNAAGYLLIGLTVAALLGELYWFIQTARQKGFRSAGAIIGLAIILLYLTLGYIAFFAK